MGAKIVGIRLGMNESFEFAWTAETIGWRRCNLAHQQNPFSFPPMNCRSSSEDPFLLEEEAAMESRRQAIQ
jgi:hypothetical protein